MNADDLTRLHVIVRDERKLHRLVDALTAAVMLSGKVRPMASRSIVAPSVTMIEAKRRLNWVMEWAIARIKEDGWAVQRVVDKCYPTLQDWLDTKDVTPSKSAMWSVE